MAGCVLDGLYDLWKSTGQDRYHAALQAHLDHFFNDEQRLIYESPRSEPLDGMITGIESTLPNAVIAKLDPQHPVLEDVVAFWLNTRDSENSVQDGQTTSAEGSYTVGYPMMVIGQARGDQELMQLAVQQIRIRKKRLIHKGDCWLRYHGDDSRTYRNWARGVAWYGLGLVRTLIQGRGMTGLDDLKQEVERLAGWVKGYQQQDGLWRCFLHENVRPDTSGSAGIAAALALAIKHDLLSDSYLPMCQRTRDGLIPYLTPDGLLSGVAQSNRGGETLQRSDYRVISPMGMGLMAQLISALQ
jgi:rhamnogalacturonyl hydrolase YesR